MPARKEPADLSVYQLKITLKDSKPPIWRGVQVTGDTTLADLHETIQMVMEWDDSHLHKFTVGGERYGEPEAGRVKDEGKVKLSQIVPKEGFKFLYTYDFGDNWEHEILVEKILPREPGKQYPVCIAGKRAGPPEDSGGVWGYAELLQAIRDPDHPEHDEMLEWVGEDFDPEAFDLEEVNARLREYM